MLIEHRRRSFPIPTKIGDGTKLFDQFMIPRFKLVQNVTLLKELNAARYPSLPGFDGLVIEGRTFSDRQVLSKQDGEDVPLCSWKRHEWRKRKESLERLVESFDWKACASQAWLDRGVFP